MQTHSVRAALATILLAAVASPTFAQAPVGAAAPSPTFTPELKRPYSPFAGRTFPSLPLFGDTHLHTSDSMDASAFGARLSPRDAYRFAKGDVVQATPAKTRYRTANRPASANVGTQKAPGWFSRGK